MIKSLGLWALVMAFYAIAGWQQRGWFDWYGLAAVTVLTLPLVCIFSIRNAPEKKASSQSRNPSRKANKDKTLVL